jgi:glycosyltransferase involved in cell wall biosynthesis
MDERGDITIVIMGVKHQDGEITKGMMEDYDFWSTIKNIEWHPYCHVTEYMSKVASLALDLAIIPRKEHYFNQCKSNLKLLEMSLLKIPVIAQGFLDGSSPYEDFPRGLLRLVYDNSTWAKEIINIKENYKHSKAIAEEAHDYVLEFFNIETYAQEWVEGIKQLIK